MDNIPQDRYYKGYNYFVALKYLFMTSPCNGPFL